MSEVEGMLMVAPNASSVIDVVVSFNMSVSVVISTEKSDDDDLVMLVSYSTSFFVNIYLNTHNDVVFPNHFLYQ